MKGKKTLHSLQQKIATATGDMNEWRELETEAAKELIVSQADLARQSPLCKSSRGMVDTYARERMGLQAQLASNRT